MRLRIPAVHRQKAIALAESGYVDIESLINADIPELEKVRTIGNKTAVKIKEFVSKFIKDKDKKIKESQKLRAVKLGRDSTIIERIYNSKSDEFSRVVAEVIKDFCEEAIKNTEHTKITLISAKTEYTEIGKLY